MNQNRTFAHSNKHTCILVPFVSTLTTWAGTETKHMFVCLASDIDIHSIYRLILPPPYQVQGFLLSHGRPCPQVARLRNDCTTSARHHNYLPGLRHHYFLITWTSRSGQNHFNCLRSVHVLVCYKMHVGGCSGCKDASQLSFTLSSGGLVLLLKPLCGEIYGLPASRMFTLASPTQYIRSLDS